MTDVEKLRASIMDRMGAPTIVFKRGPVRKIVWRKWRWMTIDMTWGQTDYHARMAYEDGKFKATFYHWIDDLDTFKFSKRANDENMWWKRLTG